MKKVVIHRPGSYESLAIEQHAQPRPGPDDVLIAVRACGVNFADCCVRMGVYRPANEFAGFPITPGFEVSGIVLAKGEGVTEFNVEDRVCALTLFGGYASHLVVPKKQVFHLPKNMSFEEGAAFPTIFLTAYYGLCELATVKEGSAVLVHSAAGGVGSALVQLAKLKKCKVAGVVGASHKLASVKELGADCVIDKSTQDLWAEAEKFCTKGYDVILDANGPDTLKASYNHLALGGKLVVYGFHTMLSKGRGTPNWLKVIWQYVKTPRFNPMNMTTDNHSILAFNLAYLFDQTELIRGMMDILLRYFSESKLVLPVITSFQLREVKEAHRALESGQTIGKLILIP